MSKIVKLLIKDFLGIKELGMAPGKINIFKGPMGSGKSSVIEAIEKGFTNNNRRTEVVRHGAEEATLFIELDNGLEIDRRIRMEKSDYLKLRKENEHVPSTEKFLRSLVSGEIFRPIEWVYKDIKEQTKSILNMLEIPWTQDNIVNWFGELTYNIDYSKHILQVLKAIEMKYYNDREEINREIKELKTRIAVIVKELPAGYDGELWRHLKVQDYYNKVKEAQQINSWIAEAKSLQENIEARISAIEARWESEKNKLLLKFKDDRSDIEEIVHISTDKIEKSKNTLQRLDRDYEAALKVIDSENHRINSTLQLELQNKIQALKDEYAQRISFLIKESEEDKDRLKLQLEKTKEECREIIGFHQNKISAKEQELKSMDSIEAASLKALEEKKLSEIEKEQLLAGQASEYLIENSPIDLEPLQRAADEVAEMQSYLRQRDTMVEIRDEKLAAKEKYAAWLTVNIDRARTLPLELLKTAKMPVEGISIDDKGLIRINGTLIDGLSDGEKLELALKIARAQAGELKVICIDKWESLNEKAQQKLQEEMEKDDFQYFVTVVGDTAELKIDN